MLFRFGLVGGRSTNRVTVTIGSGTDGIAARGFVTGSFGSVNPTTDAGRTLSRLWAGSDAGDGFFRLGFTGNQTALPNFTSVQPLNSSQAALGSLLLRSASLVPGGTYTGVYTYWTWQFTTDLTIYNDWSSGTRYADIA